MLLRGGDGHRPAPHARGRREEGYPDFIARPDTSTMTTLPWEPGVASCLANLEPAAGGAPIPDPRGSLRQAVENLRASGLDPIVGPELEFFLVQLDPAKHGIRRRVDQAEHGLHGRAAGGPDGIVRTCQGTGAARGGGPRLHPRVHEQPVRDQPASHRCAAGRRSSVPPEVGRQGHRGAARLVATFMGRPFNDQGGSGTHLHVSLNRGGATRSTRRRRSTASAPSCARSRPARSPTPPG